MRLAVERYLHRCAMALATGLVASLTVACGACSEEPAAPPAGDAGAQAEAAELPTLPDDVPMPGVVYDQAYQRALEELDADNAADRLREMERQIARERRELE